MEMKIPMVVISAFVVVVVLAAVLMPVLEDATDTEDTFTNEGGYYRMGEINAADDTEYTLSWVKTDTTILTINGVDFDANAAYGTAATTVVASENWMLRYHSIDGPSGYLQYYDGTSWAGDATTKSMDITASNGTVTITYVMSTDVTNTKTVTYTKLYAIMPDSTDDEMKKPTETPYLLGDSSIYAMGVTSGITGLIKIEGTINDGVDIDVIGNNSETISNIVIDKTAVSGYKDLYKVSKITFDVEISGVTTSCTYNFFIVPYEVTAEKSQHLDTNEIAIFGAIPVLVIVALLIGVLALYMRSRMD